MKLYCEHIHHREKAYYKFDRKIIVRSTDGKFRSDSIRQMHHFLTTAYGPSIDIDTADTIDVNGNWDTGTWVANEPRKWSFKPGDNVFYVQKDVIEYLNFYYPNMERYDYLR